MTAHSLPEASGGPDSEFLAVNRALESLAEPRRRLLLLRHKEHHTFEEIGRRLGCSTDEARQEWCEALAHLADELTSVPSTPRQARRLEDPLAVWLVQFHEAVQVGKILELPPEYTSDRGMVAVLHRAMAAIQLLERVWPLDRVSTRPFAGEPPTLPGAELDWLRTGRFTPMPDGGTTVAKSISAELHVPGFEVLEQVGRGGMGVVYRARQPRLDREVALKVLPPGLAADPERLQRFYIEAAAAARLNDARVLPVLDLLDLDGTPVLVLPYVRGGDLGRIIRDRTALRQGRPVPQPHPWSALGEGEYVEKLLPLFDQLLEAVGAVHRAGVLHRDIKPANILVEAEDKLWLSDFGLARLGQQAELTAPGQGMGSPGYMSPEQWDGAEDLDSQADVFGLGVTLYHALTLELPYGRARLRDSQRLPAAPNLRQPLLSVDLGAVVLKALEPDRAHRYRSATEFRDDWRRARQGQLPVARRVGPLRRLARRLRRQPLGAFLVLLVTALGVAASFAVLRRSPESEPTLTRESPAVTRQVEVVSDPPGARVALVPLDENGEPRGDRAIRPGTERQTPVQLRVPPGDYLVVAALPDGRFHEVYRHVPPPTQEEPARADAAVTPRPDEVVRLAPVVIPPRGIDEGMARFEGGEFLMGPACELYKKSMPQHKRRVAPYYLDTTEVTVAAYRKRGFPLPAAMVKRHPGPPPAFDQYAISGVSFYRAVQYAEYVGKRLPTEAEFEYAATGGGKFVYPWGNEPRINSWPLGPVKEPSFDRTDTDPPVYGLYSNVAEWTDSLPTPYPVQGGARVAPPRDYSNKRVIRGAPPWALREQLADENERILDPSPWLTPRWRQHTNRDATFVTVGFRCARSAAPRFLDDGPPP